MKFTGTRALRLVLPLMAAIFLFAFCVAIALPAAVFPEAVPFTALFTSIQLFPAMEKAVLSGILSAGIIALALTALTLAFGRFYCSLLCPLGTCQDGAAALFKHRRRRFQAGRGPVRVLAFVLCVGGMVFGMPMVATLLEPYTVFARGFSRSFGDLALVACNALESLGLPLPVFSLDFDASVLIAAVFPFIAILFASMLRSRFFCGTLCPAGTILGALNVLALVRVRLDAGACTSCGVCERVCRTGCIDAKKKHLDPWGCVQCLDCIVVCPHGALRYGTVRRGAARVCSRSSLKTGRLEFLKTSAAALAAAAGVASLRFLPERAGMEPRSRSASARAMAVPPGAMSVERYAARCTACATCVRACPPGVLRLSLLEFGITRPLVPWLDYGRAFCQYECTACGEVCPSGAILKLEKPVKKLTAIGKSELVLAKCIVVEKKTACGACAEHCPSGAVRMVRDSGYDLPIPKLVISTCIGCGACETICPSKPEKAIVVSGISVHEIADKPATYDDEIPELSDEFPF